MVHGSEVPWIERVYPCRLRFADCLTRLDFIISMNSAISHPHLPTLSNPDQRQAGKC